MTCTESIRSNRGQINEDYFGVPRNEYKVWTNYALAISPFGSTTILMTAGPSRIGNRLTTEFPTVSLVIPKNPQHAKSRLNQGINIASETDQQLFKSFFSDLRFSIENMVSDLANNRQGHSANISTRLHEDRDYFYFSFNHMVPATKGKCNNLFKAVIASLKVFTPEIGNSLEESHISLRSSI